MEEIVNQILNKGVANIYPSKEFLEAKLRKGEKLTLYLGIDPTGPTLHLGHVIPMMKLAQFQKLGHKVILLMGDFTAMIGDPTDKSATRTQLTRKEVLNNLKSYKKQASSILNFSGKNKAEIKFNSKWLGKMKFSDVLSLASNMTVQQMLERDMFEKRIEEGKSIYLHEFMYPLMQGYDSVAMNVDGEVGGNDQTFNMLTGRTLMKKMLDKEKFVITMKLLEDSNGKKMGKTEGNMLALCDSSDEMYGKVMSWTDGMIIPAFELCTLAPESLVEEIAKDIAQGVNPKELKMKLAFEIVKTFHGEVKAKNSQISFENTFGKNEIPENISEIKLGTALTLAELFKRGGVISSNSEFQRLVSEGAVTNITNNVKVTSVKDKPTPGVYRIGKKRFIKLV